MHVRAHIEIRRPPEDVFDYLTDFTNLTRWTQGVRRVEALSPETGCVGARYRIVGGISFYKLENVYEVTAHGRPQRFAGRNQGLLHFEEVYELSARNGGTHISQTANVTLPGAAALLSPVVRIMMGNQLTADFKRLKRILEKDPPRKSQA